MKASPLTQRLRLALAGHLRDCGQRAIVEALQAVERGQPVNSVLEQFSKLPTQTYKTTLRKWNVST